MDQKLISKRKEFRTFKQKAHYVHNQDNWTYNLMPFRFKRLKSGTELLVNEVGDFLLVPNGTAERVINRHLNLEKDTELIADLTANFFISEHSYSPLIDVLATRYRTKKQFLDSFTSLHIFVISLRCEHTCQYCQVSRVTQDKDRFDMSRANIDAGIDIMMKTPSEHVTMEFQGGEALLAFENIKYAVVKAEEKARQFGKEITFVVCSNLALVDRDILSFCKEHRILMSASLDGPKYVHDKNRHKPRASSYDLTIKGIELCREVLGYDQVSVLMTTTNLSLQYPTEIVDEYRNRGFQGIFLRNISPYGFALRTETSKYETSKFLDFYKEALSYIIEINKRGERFTEDFTRILLRKVLTPFGVGFVDMQSPAGAITAVIVFNYDGGVYATDESRMLAENMDFTFKMGHLQENTYEEIMFGPKVKKLASVWANESLAGCSECAYQVYCGADPVHSWATQGDVYGYRPNSSFCEKNMGVLDHIFNLMETDKDVKSIFESWLS